MFIERQLSNELRKAANSFPAVTLTGPKQSGKTTLVKNIFPEYNYVSLELPEEREFAVTDPKGFLAQFSGPVIIDEIQRVPDLLSYIQVAIDEDPDTMGKFILTGSQNFLMLEKVSQSLAGRTAIFKLLPFSLSEIQRREPINIESLGTQSHLKQWKVELPEQSLFEILYTGFYPPIHARNLEPRKWLASYYETYIERDVRTVVNVGDLETFSRFVRLCAGRTGQLLNLSSLASDAGISHTTARRWISVLEASHIIYLLRPYHRNFGKRLVKSPKLYFIDTGLLSYLLNIRNPEEIIHRAERGAIFETFIISEIIKNFYNKGENPPIYFWRDSAGHEIDLVIELGKELIAIEIKSGQTLSPDFFKNLLFWKQLTDQDTRLVLFYGGDKAQFRSEVAVYPWYGL